MSSAETEINAQINQQRQASALIYGAFVAGLCSIVYELLIATTVSYFLGDSVTYFSVTIGLYMAAMGAGSYCSKFVSEQLALRFLQLETALAVVGGLSVPLLYLSYVAGDVFVPTYVVLTLAVGFLIGMEIPFLTRLMEDFQTLKSNIANILTFDYVGALIATLAFPFFLLPMFGNYLSSLLLGLVNLSIVLVIARYFKGELVAKGRPIRRWLVVASIVLVAGIVFAGAALDKWDQALYEGRVVHAEQTRYQKIVITRQRDDTRLYLNGNIQFSSLDEYRYHEALVLYPLAHMTHQPRRVLLLGAGDGLAVKQLLKSDAVEEIVLVDLDPRVVELAQENPYLAALNENSLARDKVQLVQSDAFSYLRNNRQLFDLIICDLPDPNNISLARLYTNHFYHTVMANLSATGVFVTQATSPYFATKAFWSIVHTVSDAGFASVIPYHTEVPSFGDWGFVMASHHPSALHKTPRLTAPSQYLNDEMLLSMHVFAQDLRFPEARVNRLDRPVLLDYYLEGWRSHGY